MTPKFKVPPERVPSDDCAIMLGQVIKDGKVMVAGTPYYIHKGESVEVLPVRTMRETLALASFLRNTDGRGADSTIALAVNLETLCAELSKRVVSWDWTDLAGKALPQPYERPDVIQSLSNEEVIWLVNATQEATPEQRGNVSTPSPATSSTKRGRSQPPPKSA